MPRPANKPVRRNKQLQPWTKRVQKLVDETAAWSRAEGWKVAQHTITIREPLLGLYNVPAITIHLPEGEILVNPIALHIAGGNGRVDLEAVPTLNRVKLIGNDQGDWNVITDSNVPLRTPWDAKNFVRLVHDLLA